MKKMFKTVMIILIASALSVHAQEALELSRSYELPYQGYSIKYPADWFVREAVYGSDFFQIIIAATKRDAFDEHFFFFDPSPFNPLEQIRISLLIEPLSFTQGAASLRSLQAWQTFLKDPVLENLFQFGISSAGVKLLGEPEEIQILGVPALKAQVSDEERRTFGIVIQGFIDTPEMDQADRAFAVIVETTSLEELTTFLPTWDEIQSSLTMPDRE